MGRPLSGMPDGILNQKFLFGSILVGLASEDFGIFYGHLVNFTAAIWYNLWSFG
jgi:hypothetical protein